MSVPAGRRFISTQTKEVNGNEVMAELQALLRGRRATTEKALGSPRAQRRFAGGGKSSSISEKRFNSVERLPLDSREAGNSSPLSPSTGNTKWHVAIPKNQMPASSKAGLTGSDPELVTKISPKRPIQPPLKSSPIPIQGTGGNPIPEQAGSEPKQKRHKELAFSSSVGAVVNMSVASSNQVFSNSSSSGQKTALTQSLPKSSRTRIGPPPDAPPPRLVQQGTPGASVTSGVASSSPATSGKLKSGGNTDGKQVPASKVSSPFPPKLTKKTSNITFNEPVKATKKVAAKKAPLATTKSSTPAGIKRLFKKKGNKKTGTTAPSGTGTEPNHLKKFKPDPRFNSRPQSPEVDQVSDMETDNSPRFPVSCSIPTSTSTPAFGYQNVFDDEVFLRRNQHRMEEVPIDKKPKPLPRKISASNTVVHLTERRSAFDPYELASLTQKEEGSYNQDSDLEVPYDIVHEEPQRDEGSRLNFLVGSPPQRQIDNTGAMPVDKQTLSPSSSKARPLSTSSVTKDTSPTARGSAMGTLSPMSPEQKRPSTLVASDIFKPVVKMGSRVSLLSDLTKLPLFDADPGLGSVSAVETKDSTSTASTPQSDLIRGRNIPKELRRALNRKDAQLSVEETDDDYIAMNSFRVSSNLELSEDGNFPMDPRASGYYLKILAPDENPETAGKSNKTDGSDDECPSSPEPYHEVNLGPIRVVPDVESIKSPENEYISINTDHLSTTGDSLDRTTREVTSGAEKLSDDRCAPYPPTKQIRRISGVQECCTSSSSSDISMVEAEQNERSNENRIQITDTPCGLKYSDVTINPVDSTGNRKLNAPKKFSYQLVQLERGKKINVEDSDTLRTSPSPSSKDIANKKHNQEAAAKLSREKNESPPVSQGERKISLPVETHSKQFAAAGSSPVNKRERKISLPAVNHLKTATSGEKLEDTRNDAASRLASADRPPLRVPMLQQQQEDTNISTKEEDEKLYYETTSSFAGHSGSSVPPPVSVSIPAKAPAGRVIWHEYVEIDQEEIERMGCSLPVLSPAQFLRLVPVISNNESANATVAEGRRRWNIPSYTDFDDDVSDTCSIYRSDSVDSCPYIEPLQVGSPPAVPDRPDNLDEVVERKGLLQSGEYAYAAVPTQNFGIKWMRFQSSDPRHIRLAPFSESDDTQGYIIATPETEFTDDKDSNSRQQKANLNQPESQHSDHQKNDAVLYPPILPPKTASLLREQRQLHTERPQSYLIPVLTNKAGKVGESLLATKNESKSTSQLSTSIDTRDAATGERMERRKVEATKPKRVPPLKPKPYREFKEQQTSLQEGMQVVLLGESNVPYQPVGAESKFFQKLGIISSDVALGHTKLKREKSQSTGNLLETSSEFEVREKWIASSNKQDNTANVGTTSSGAGQKVNQQQTMYSQDRGQPSKQPTHKPFRPRSDAVMRKPRKTSNDFQTVVNEPNAQIQGRAMDPQSMAVIRQNRDTIVKHLSKALDMDSLELDFGQAEESSAIRMRKVSQNENARGLSEILSELDSLLKNRVFSTEDLLQAIQSRLNITVNIPSDANQQGKENDPPPKERKVSQKTQDTAAAQEMTEHHGGIVQQNVEAAGSDAQEKELGMKSKARYVNEEFLPRLKSMKTVNYTPPYVNHTFTSGTDESAPNSQSSDQSSASNDSQSTPRFSRYENLDNWIEKSLKSDSSVQEEADSESSTKIGDSSTEEGTQSASEKTTKPSAPKPSMRARSQSSIEVSPKPRRKKHSHPEPSRLSDHEVDSPTRGYQLALQMEEERLCSNGAYGVYRQKTESGNSRRRQALSTVAITSEYSSTQKSHDEQLPPPTLPSILYESYGKSLVSSSAHSENQTPSRLPQTGVATKSSMGNESSTTAAPQQSFGMRDSRSLSVGNSNSFYRMRRPFINTENDATNGQSSTFMNGVGVFTHRGGILMNAGSSVVIEIPEDAIPRGKKQKIWFEVIQEVFNPLHENELEASHPFTDSFQFHTGSTEFENYLAGKRERKVQLSLVILIGPADVTLSRPIKIKIPHCLPYQNNSWHLHMLARTQNSEANDWTELSNTIGLVDLPPKKTGDKSYRKSSYQMHIDYVQVYTKYAA